MNANNDALLFYADPKNYVSPESNDGNSYLASKIDKDGGELARAAIRALSADRGEAVPVAAIGDDGQPVLLCVFGGTPLKPGDCLYTRPAESAAQSAPVAAPDGLPDDATSLEVIEHFIRVCREMKPVGQWPGERVCLAIERMFMTPRHFIAPELMSPERGHNGRGGDEESSLPPFRRRPAAAPTAPPVAVDGESVLSGLPPEVERVLSWLPSDDDANALRAYIRTGGMVLPAHVKASADFLLQRLEHARCDSEAVSCCVRCNAIVLARYMLGIKPPPLRMVKAATPALQKESIA